VEAPTTSFPPPGHCQPQGAYSSLPKFPDLEVRDISKEEIEGGPWGYRQRNELQKGRGLGGD